MIKTRIEVLERRIQSVSRRVYELEDQLKLVSDSPLRYSCSCGWKLEPGASVVCNDVISNLGYCPRCGGLLELPKIDKCKHGKRAWTKGACPSLEFRSYKDKFCRDCGESLQE